MFKRLRWMAIGLATGLVMGGVAYAVVVNPPGAGDRYFACVSPGGIVRADTIRRNSPPTKCASRTDQVQSWNAQGTTGPTGPTGAAGSGGSGFRSYVGTYTVRHTNSGCGAAQMRIELVAVAGAAPTNPFGPCLDIVCASSVYFGPEVLGVGDSCSLGQDNIYGYVLSYFDECVNLRAALAVGEMAVELERWDANLGNPAEQEIVRIADGPMTDLVLTSRLQQVRSGTPAPEGGQSLCASLTGFINEFVPMVSLVGKTSPTDGNPVWSVYSIA